MQKQEKIDIQKHPKYGKYIKQTSKAKMLLNMQSKRVTDQMLQEIAQFDLRKIQKLYLYNNQITDCGFDLLFQNREWPVLQKIDLSSNKIQNIPSLHKIPNLQQLDIPYNELSEASGTYMCEHQWPKLTHLGISFKWGVNDKCWEKLLTVMKQKFPKLKELRYFQKGDVSSKKQEKIATYCNKNSIDLSSR